MMMAEGAFRPASAFVEDPYQNCYDYKTIVRKKTAFIYVPSSDHKNVWEDDHPECPARAVETMRRLQQMYLSDKCERILDPLDDVNEDSLLELVHTRTMINNFRNMCSDNCEEAARALDSVYFNNMDTFLCAKDTAAMCVALTVPVAEGTYQNGFAVVRPPGHHASNTTPNGYCIFNNVAICAEEVLRRGLAKRILIVDHDIHHGQGTQRHFYNRNDVLYFSIHRYENGRFWPHLRESDADYIGEGEGLGYNVNVPLNEIGLTDTDYMAIVTNILLPIAYEYNPDLILISAGFDSCIGCPEGEMNVTPAFYGHLITLLSGLANGKIVCLLEGGYFLDSLIEGFVHTVRALLGEPCDPVDMTKKINPSVINSINDVKYFLRPYSNCFKLEDIFNCPPNLEYNRSEEHIVVTKYHGSPGSPPFKTRGYFPILEPSAKEFLIHKLNYLRKQYDYKVNRVGFVYSELLLLHDAADGDSFLERPERLKEIIKKLNEFDLLQRILPVTIGEHHEEAWMKSVHHEQYIDNILKRRNIEQLSDWYWNEHTPDCLKLSVAAMLTLCVEMHNEIITSGIALIRPPGHHAKRDSGSGFCFVNNVCIGAHFVSQIYGYTRILIIDFDVHHGDGIQDITYDRDDIMYISIHRYDDGKFFPSSPKGNYNYIGTGKGNGYNVNIPFNKEKMSDIDYLTVWTRLVLPLAYSYSPEIVFISAGFDAGINDSLGNYNVKPETFGHMIQMIKPLGKTVIVLEGGYQCETTALSMAMCVKALVGDPLPVPKLGKINYQTKATIDNVVKTLKPYWPILEVNKSICIRKFSEQYVEMCRLNLNQRDKKTTIVEPQIEAISVSASSPEKPTASVATMIPETASASSSTPAMSHTLSTSTSTLPVSGCVVGTQTEPGVINVGSITDPVASESVGNQSAEI